MSLRRRERDFDISNITLIGLPLQVYPDTELIEVEWQSFHLPVILIIKAEPAVLSFLNQ